MDANMITERLKAQGWKLLELPVRRNHPNPGERTIKHWKIIAVKGEKSYETTGDTKEYALEKLGQVLGVIPRGSN